MKKILSLSFFLMFATNCFAGELVFYELISDSTTPDCGNVSLMGIQSNVGYTETMGEDHIWTKCKCLTGITSGTYNPPHKITYQTINKNHEGTEEDPWILTSCQDAGVVVTAKYFLSSGTVTACNEHALSTDNVQLWNDGGVRYSGYTSATSCQYCPPNFYVKDISDPAGTCAVCPDSGKKDGVTKDGITSCYKTEVSGEDNTGYFVSSETEKCYYKF